MEFQSKSPGLSRLDLLICSAPSIWGASALERPTAPFSPDSSIRTARAARRTSFDSIYLPRYSGVRPTISPAMKTERTANTSMK